MTTKDEQRDQILWFTGNLIHHKRIDDSKNPEIAFVSRSKHPSSQGKVVFSSLVYCLVRRKWTTWKRPFTFETR